MEYPTNVDIDYLNRNKIALGITSTSNAVSVAEHVMSTSGNKGSYLCGWPDSNLLSAIMKDQMTAAGLKSISLPEYLRVRQRGDLLF